MAEVEIVEVNGGAGGGGADANGGEQEQPPETLKGSNRISEFQNTSDPLTNLPTAQIKALLTKKYRTSDYAAKARARIQEISSLEGLVIEKKLSSEAKWLKQLSTLTQRSFLNMSRDLGYYWLRIGIYIVLAISVGSIFFNIGTNYNAILARGACGGFLSGFMTFLSIGGFPSFIEELKASNLILRIFWRYPVSYINYGAWALEGAYKNDMLGLEFDGSVPGGPKLKGDVILTTKLGIRLDHSKWWDLAAVVMILTTYRFLFLVILKFKERASPFFRTLYAKRTLQHLKKRPSFRKTLAFPSKRHQVLHSLSSQEGLNSPIH
ncbi:ABC-2 type transporter [Corchorus capsularis]|uniref:ABC-2 type transporter n=1 Tax=Corchorus capsularis TaxID=210143 RepID=A0A1R3IGQ4_COCAP|nr:ABC-2 type transporter [Corchorus capsularis]